MPKRSGGGSLNAKITFQRRSVVLDPYGNEVLGPFVDQFDEPARLMPRLGGNLGVESVMAARLASHQPYSLTVRSSSRTRAITAEWRAVDARNVSRVFNIKTVVNPDERGAYLELLVVEGEVS